MASGLWWQYGILYEVYPRSFQDANGDGIGDLQGILRRLDYLAGLGIKGIWIAPFYPSPMADFGYDISDYCNIDPIFGTLDDFDRLLKAIHDRGLKLILDFVPNHTSDQHPWFQESRSSLTNPKRDWYLWHDPAPDGGPPNNWLSNFGGSAWTKDGSQYYCHSFLKQQPDVNWRNPGLRAAMFDVLRFWLDRGVDGFRVDVMWMMIKDDQFRDNPVNPATFSDSPDSVRLLPVYNQNRPEVHAIVAEMRAILDSYGDRLLIGETYLSFDQLATYYGRNLEGAQLPFNFHLIQTPWKADAIAAVIKDYEASLPPGAWPNWVIGNHDQPRIATRVGRDQARIAAMLLLTLRGTPTMYYGDEVGMTDVPIPRGEVQDSAEKNQPGKGLGRDPERTPMQWDDSANAGFTRGKPWLRLAADFASVNVAVLSRERDSLLSLYRELIRLRTFQAALHGGSVREVASNGPVLRYERVEGTERFAVLLNLSAAKEEAAVAAGRIAISTHMDREEAVEGRVLLRPFEGVVVDLD
ncbi:MAG TPA: alpha-amylase family glycosyl hydrolase [Acidobacteriaceae bacterium]|nr:alpha-amylase family glycosyl hydrolase [Acidobacteriaceae bacterium]